jgi:hypothetical protein
VADAAEFARMDRILQRLGDEHKALQADARALNVARVEYHATLIAIMEAAKQEGVTVATLGALAQASLTRMGSAPA